MFHRYSVAEINIAHLEHNTNLMFDISGRPKFFCPMVKANAYGHGDAIVSQALAKLPHSHLGVGLIEEAITLRKSKIKSPILFFGMFDRASCKAILENELTPVISDLSELDFLSEALSKRQNPRLKIHIKFNTGMNRLGFETKDAEKVANYLRQNRKFLLEGTCTHLFAGEDAGEPNMHSDKQLFEFFEADKKFYDYPHVVHALNSSAAVNLYLRSQNSKANKPAHLSVLGVRPGISIYGGGVATKETGSIDLRPVMSLKSKLVKFHSVKKGETISYGGRWRAEKDSLIGVVPFGYADGFFRGTNGGEALCHGELIPVVGTICMDYFMVDLTALSSQQNVNIGDEIVIMGRQNNKQILASDLAKKVGTISYEVLTRISDRVPRVYLTSK